MRPTDARWRLRRQLPTQFLQDQPMFGFRLGVARHHQFPSIGQRHMDVQHQNARKGFQHGPRCQSRGVGLQPLAQGHTQAIGHPGAERCVGSCDRSAIAGSRPRSSSDVTFHPFCDCYSAKTYHWPTVYQAGWAAEKRVGRHLRDFENAGLGVQQLTSKAR